PLSAWREPLPQCWGACVLRLWSHPTEPSSPPELGAGGPIRYVPGWRRSETNASGTCAASRCSRWTSLGDWISARVGTTPLEPRASCLLIRAEDSAVNGVRGEGGEPLRLPAPRRTLDENLEQRRKTDGAGAADGTARFSRLFSIPRQRHS